MPTKKEISKEKSMTAILDAAAREFSEMGYSGATIRSIAAAAGVSGGLIGKYFESKDRLLLAVIEKCNLASMYEGVEYENPYQIFCIYLNRVKELYRRNPVMFKLYSRMLNDVDFPASAYETVRNSLLSSHLKTAFLEAQRDGDMFAGDIAKIFKILASSAYMLISQHSSLGINIPDNDTMLQILGYDRRGKIYAKQALRSEQLEKDLHLLGTAIQKQYPFIVSVDLTDETYHLVEWECFPTEGVKTSGRYNTFIELTAAAIPDEKIRNTFITLFGREGLIKAHQSGKTEEAYIYQMTGVDGIAHWVLTRCIMVDEAGGNIEAVFMSSVIDEQIERDIREITAKKDESPFFKMIEEYKLEA